MLRKITGKSSDFREVGGKSSGLSVIGGIRSGLNRQLVGKVLTCVSDDVDHDTCLPDVAVTRG